MTTTVARWVDLAQASPPRRSRDLRRRDALIICIVAAIHLMVLIQVGQSVKPSPLPSLDDLPALTVSLMPSLARSGTPAAPLAQANASPSPLKVAQDRATEVTKPDQPLGPDLLPPVTLTAQPIALSIARPSANASPAPAAAVTDAEAGACDLTGALQAALQGNPAVLDELARIPRQERSVANAIMLWDGRWSAVATPGYADMADPLRQTILSSVRSLPPRCQAQLVAGPRLLTISDSEGTTVLALGSGAWRWADLLTSSESAH